MPEEMREINGKEKKLHPELGAFMVVEHILVLVHPDLAPEIADAILAGGSSNPAVTAFAYKLRNAVD